LPIGSRAILDAMVAKHPIMARGDDHDRRLLNQAVCEQFRFTFGPGWGNKSAHLSLQPTSKDALCFNDQNTGTIWYVDWQNGTTRMPQVVDEQPMQVLLGQWFIEVQPKDHLGMTPPHADSPAPEPPDVPNESELTSSINKMRAELHLYRLQLDSIKAKQEETYEEFKDVAALLGDVAVRLGEIGVKLDTIRDKMDRRLVGSVELFGARRISLTPEG
jgi:hypothetical protein